MKRRVQQAGLFDAQAEPAPRLFVATNRHNALKALASRIVGTLESHTDKYYDDLLRFAPGRIPILAHGLPRGLVAEVAAPPPDFPLLMELDPARLAVVEVPALGRAADRTQARPGSGAAVAWAPCGPIPFSAVTAMHFRSGEEQEAFELNEFADVRPVPDLLRVSPDLFGAETPPADTLTEWLRSLPPCVPMVDPRTADRRAGALLLAATTCDSTRATEVAALLAADSASTTHESELMLGGWIANGREGGAGVATMAAIVARELAAIDRARSWRPAEVIAAILDRLQAALPPEETRIAEGVLGRLGAILRSDEAFEHLRPGGSDPLKALLLVMMRPDPERFAAWDMSSIGADAAVRLEAWALLGALNGRSRLPVSMRPVILDDAVAEWECRLALPVEMQVRLGQEIRVAQHAGEAALMCGDRVLRVLPDPATVGRPESPRAPDREHDATAPLGAEELSSEAARDAALHLAIREGWWEVVSTTIRATSAAVHVSAEQATSLVVEVTGNVEVTQRVEIEPFLSRLRAASMESEFRAAVKGPDPGDAGPSTPTRRTRKRKG